MVLRLVLFFLLSLLPGLPAQVPAERPETLEKIAVSAIRRAYSPALSAGAGIGDGPAWNAAWRFSDLEDSGAPETARQMSDELTGGKP